MGIFKEANNFAFPQSIIKATIDYGEVLYKMDDNNAMELFVFEPKESPNYFRKDAIMNIQNYFCLICNEDNQLRDENSFEYICESPFQSCFGQETFPSVFLKAAKFLEGFSTHQVFINGNKRLGCAVMYEWLDRNHYALTYNKEGIYNLVMKVANRNFRELDENGQDVVNPETGLTKEIENIANEIEAHCLDILKLEAQCEKRLGITREEFDEIVQKEKEELEQEEMLR